MSADEKEYEDKAANGGLQAATGPADGSLPGDYRKDEEHGGGMGYDVARVNGVRKCRLPSTQGLTDGTSRPRGGSCPKDPQGASS